MARRALERATRTGTELASLDFGDFIPAVTPGYHRPDHLGPLLDVFRRIDAGEEVHAILSVPPRHEKTTTINHAIAQLLARHPEWPIAYVSHAADFAAERCRQTRRIAERAGVKLGEKVTEGHWETSAGGQLFSCGVMGALIGRGFKLIVTDDPTKNRADAESPTVRRKINTGWRSDIFSRREPSGTSDLIVAARWHPDDLPGHVEREITDVKWEVINLPAIDDDGNALAPSIWPLDKLLQIKAGVGEYAWNSLYQGRPRPRGGSVFNGVTSYREVPSNLQKGIGLDLAYTAKTSADWSISLVLGREPGTNPPRFYVLDVQRKQVAAPEFGLTLKAHQGRHPGARMRWYVSGTEKGSADFLKRAGLKELRTLPAVGDKFVRAQPAAAAWNDGRILVPEQAPWLGAFLDVVLGFTGTGDACDDDVDALAAAYDEIAAGVVTSAGSARTERDTSSDLL